MTASALQVGIAPRVTEGRRVALTLAVGLLALYLPTWWWAAGSIWQTDEHAHGPLVLAVTAWLFWRQREALAAAATRPSPGWGWPLFALGLAMYLVGRVVGISILELGSQPFVLAGAVLLLKGRPALAAVWFAVVYTVFMIPLPGVLVDALTGPLKQWISGGVEAMLHAVGYPIARSGVTITIGQYQLLVADACSGLNSMVSLSALGTLFMVVMGRPGRLHNGLMLAAILPIAFVANMVRVILLVLITYHLGDEAGQGFLHGAAGFALMLVALSIFFALDALLARVLPQPARASGRTPR